jgi:hypothetical protein
MLVSGVCAPAATHYVDVNSTNATPPYTNWVTAATSIQDALGAALAGDEVVVADGFYYAPVLVGIPLNVRSVNGPESTTIDGSYLNQCAYLTNGASLSGFTLTRGRVFDNGGGVSGGTLNNCKLTFNWSGFSGGAAYLCTLNNCTLSDNQTYSSPGADAFGGGAYQCTLNNCSLISNSAGAVTNGYSFYGYGGGAYYCTLNNCILSFNSALGTHNFGGGAANCTLNNCIFWLNAASQGADVYGCLGSYATADPRFVHGNFPHLAPSSPCINAGNNSYVTTAIDLDGNPRIIGGTVDIGAYEYQSLSLINFSVVSNQAGFSITGQSNQVVTVQTSTDLLNWSPLATNTLNGHPFPFSDPIPASLPQRFYRAQAQ